MASSATTSDRAPWGVWLATAALVAAGLLAAAWVTGALATQSTVAGSCYSYALPSYAGSADPVPCEQPHTAESVAFLAASLDRSGLQEQCRSEVLQMLAADARRSGATSAYREVLVDVQAPWRRSGVRCDVVRVDYTGVKGAWVPGEVTGSAAGALAAEPRTWVQCRGLKGERAGQSVACKSSAKRIVEFRFDVRTKGEYRPDKADRAAAKACRAAAEPEVVSGAEPVLVAQIKEAVWESGSRASGRCTFTTKAWAFAGK